MAAAFVPGRGDIVWLQFTPHAGHEQAGRRPALVVSPREYNRRVGLALVCPITSRVKGYPFEVALPPGLGVEGVVLADQIRSLDWRVRDARFQDEAPSEVLDEVVARILPLVDPEEE